MKDDRVYLRHILEAIGKIESYIKDRSYDFFCEDEMMIDAVIRELEIIGEAASSISDDFRKSFPNLPYKEMTEMRNNLIHEYFDVDTEIVWETCKNDLPPLKEKLAIVMSV